MVFIPLIVIVGVVVVALYLHMNNVETLNVPIRMNIMYQSNEHDQHDNGTNEHFIW